MAELTTTVRSPIGTVGVLPGRVPLGRAKEDVRKMLRDQVAIAQRHLEEFDNWTTTCERGSARAKTFEEMPWAGQSS